MSESNTTLTARVKALKEGDSVAASKRILFEDFTADRAKKALAGLRNSLNQIAARAREATERAYKVESGQFVTYDGLAIMLVATLTCVEDEGEDDI